MNKKSPTAVSLDSMDGLRERVAELEAGNESLRLVRDEYKRHADEYRARWARLVVAPAPAIEPAPSDAVSVPRELLEDLRDCAGECYNHARLRGTSGLDQYEKMSDQASALLNGGRDE